MSENLLWELVESEADTLVFIRDAKMPAFVITSSVGHFPTRKGHQYTVHFGRGISRWSFPSHKQAMTKIVELLEKSRFGVMYGRIEYPRKPKKNTVFKVYDRKYCEGVI